MEHISISEQHYEIIKKHRIANWSIRIATEELIARGKEFSDMCDTISEYARKKNKTPDGIVKEIFYSAVEYKNFLDKNLPLEVKEAGKNETTRY
jgi:hypothetical protein